MDIEYLENQVRNFFGRVYSTLKNIQIFEINTQPLWECTELNDI